MSLTLEIRRYRRHLRRPMLNHHGFMAERSGIILRLTDSDGRRGYGEIAPLKWFGTESFQDAWAFLIALGDTVSDTVWAEVPLSLPCCRFAIDCALEMLEHPPGESSNETDAMEVAALLPSGEEAWLSAGCRIQEGYRRLKMKIGVEPFEEEIAALDRIVEIVPEGVMFRLDANGGLDMEKARRWVEHLALIDAIEFIEQPLPTRQMTGHLELAELAKERGRPELIGLDESLNEPSDVSRILGGGWPGICICKPLVQGPRETALQFMRLFGGRMVFSSAFETAIGVEAVLRIAQICGGETRALGLGTLNFFDDDGLGFHPIEPQLISGQMMPEDYASIWDRLIP